MEFGGAGGVGNHGGQFLPMKTSLNLQLQQQELAMTWQKGQSGNPRGRCLGLGPGAGPALAELLQQFGIVGLVAGCEQRPAHRM